MFRPCSPDHMLYKTGRFGVLSLSYCCKKVKVNTKSKWLQDSMIFSKFLEKMHPLRGGSLPPSRWSLSSAALSPSLLISPHLALDSTSRDLPLMAGPWATPWPLRKAGPLSFLQPLGLWRYCQWSRATPSPEQQKLGEQLRDDDEELQLLKNFFF